MSDKEGLNRAFDLFKRDVTRRKGTDNTFLGIAKAALSTAASIAWSISKGETSTAWEARHLGAIRPAANGRGSSFPVNDKA